MALTNSSIHSGRERVKEIRNDLNEVRAHAGNLKKYLNSNANYMKFVEGTNIGKTQNTKIQTMLNLLDQNLTAQTTNLTMNLNNFFSRQEELNRKAAAYTNQQSNSQPSVGTSTNSNIRNSSLLK